MANFRGLMIIAIVLLIGAVQAPNPPHTVGQGKQSADDANTKGPVCRHPVIVNCYASIYPEIDWGVVGWFYHSPFKSCRPVYSPNGVHNCTENQSLPSTREMCEDLCSEPCIMSNGSTGICTLDEVCYVVRNIVTANPRPCGSSNVNCCPKTSLSPPVDKQLQYFSVPDFGLGIIWVVLPLDVQILPTNVLAERRPICTENQDLPKTREMCEDLCGESCIMSNGSIGICTFSQICKIVNNKASANPRPCGSYDVNCCPKVTDSSLVPFEDPSGNNNGNTKLKNRIHFADQSSSRNGTLYIYSLPNNRLAKVKSN